MNVLEVYTVNAVARKRMNKTNKIASHLPPVPTGYQDLFSDEKFKTHRQGYLEAMAVELTSHIQGPSFVTIKECMVKPTDTLWNSIWQFDIKIDAD